jgi:hypothetical protein
MRHVFLAAGLAAIAGTAFADSLSPGQSGKGILTSSSARMEGSYYDCVPLNVVSGQTVVVTMTSTDFDSLLYVGHGSDCASMSVDQRNDDAPGMGRNSQVTVTIESGRTYWLRPTTWGDDKTGTYDLSASIQGASPGSNSDFQNNFRLN